MFGMKKKLSAVSEAGSTVSTSSSVSSSRGERRSGVPMPLSRESAPPLMRTNSNKRILNQRPMNLPTKTLRMKSLLWVKPTVKPNDLSNSVSSQVQ